MKHERNHQVLQATAGQDTFSGCKKKGFRLLKKICSDKSSGPSYDALGGFEELFELFKSA